MFDMWAVILLLRKLILSTIKKTEKWSGFTATILVWTFWGADYVNYRRGWNYYSIVWTITLSETGSWTLGKGKKRGQNGHLTASGENVQTRKALKTLHFWAKKVETPILSK